jgi:hypothetical protein
MLSLTWWHTPGIQVLECLRQEGGELEGILGFIVYPCLRKKNKPNKQIRKKTFRISYLK